MNMRENEKIIVRIPPSPTGNLHVGTARTALFNFLFAKKYGGKIILRMEDTDRERSREEYEKNILESLEWLGISYDEGPTKQSERGEAHTKSLQKLIDNGSAYLSQEEPKNSGDNKEVIRFKNPNREIIFHDLIRGEIKFNTTDLGDFVIAKDLETPLYHLAVVVDDVDGGVTHIIRGEDHISNTPRQILIQKALGAPRPLYAHIPLILAPDKTKLSKRHGAVSAIEYRDQGYLPEALVNYLALLGWNPGTEQEIFSLKELIQEFSLEKIQKSPAIFDKNKLEWMNKEYLSRLPEREVGEGILKFLQGMNFINPEGAARIIHERIHYYGEAKELVEQGEFDYFIEGKDVKLDRSILLQGNKLTVDNSKMHLEHIIGLLSNIPGEKESFTAEKIKEAIWDYATAEGRGSVLWPMRAALTGREKSPDPFTVAEIIGKNATMERIRKAVSVLL